MYKPIFAQERLRRARMRHEVRLFKERAREELSKEHWVRRRLAEAPPRDVDAGSFHGAKRGSFGDAPNDSDASNDSMSECGASDALRPDSTATLLIHTCLLPTLRSTLVAPVLPEPQSRRSMPLSHLPARYPLGMAPIR